MIEHQFLTELRAFRGILPDMTEEYIQTPDAPIYLSSGQNINIRSGVIEKAKGYKPYLPIAKVSSNVLELMVRQSITGTKSLLAVAPDGVYAAGANWFPVGNQTFHPQGVITYANIGNALYFTDSNQGYIYKYSSTVALAPFSSINLLARYLISHKAFLVLMNLIREGEEMPSTLWFSYPGNPDRFDEEDRLTIGSGGEIVAGLSMGDHLIIYTRDGIYLVYYVGEGLGWGVKTISEKIGAISPRSVSGNNELHYFLAPDGLCVLPQGGTPTPLSWERFNKYLLKDLDTRRLNSVVVKHVPENHRVYVVYPSISQSGNYITLVYDTDLNELVGHLHTMHPISTICVFNQALLFGTKDGYVFTQDDSCEQYGWRVGSESEFPILYFGVKTAYKRILEIDLVVEKDEGGLTFDVELGDGRALNVGRAVYPVQLPNEKGLHTVRSYVDVIANSFKLLIKEYGSPGYKIHSIALRGYVAGPR